ncbi:MAG: hypothetical protein WAQ29_07480 [Nitrososphaeraceae archaeon]
MIKSKRDNDMNENNNNKNNNKDIVKKDKDQEPPIVTLKVASEQELRWYKAIAEQFDSRHRIGMRG